MLEEDSFDVDRIDELLKLVGDEHDTDEIEADVENLADRVSSDKALLVLFSLFDFVDCEPDENEAFDFDFFFLLLLIDSFRLRRKSAASELFKTPIARADRNLERVEIEPFLSLLFRFLLDMGDRRSRKKDRTILLLCLRATILVCCELSSVVSASASALKLSLKLTFFEFCFSIELTILSISYRFSTGEIRPLISIIFSTLFSTLFRLDTVFR